MRENSIFKPPHGHVRRRLEQKPILRGSFDFEEPAEYGELLDEVPVTFRKDVTPALPLRRCGLRIAPASDSVPLLAC